MKVGVIGEQADLTYRTEYLGAGPETLNDLANGKHSFIDVLKNAQNPIILVGMAATSRPDGAAILSLAAKLAIDVGAVKDDWNGFCVLHDAAARVGGLDIGCVPGEGGRATPAILKAAEAGELDVLFLLGADEIDTSKLGNTFVIYQGSHGDRGAHRADVILPGATYTEKSGIYVNTEGRPQVAGRASFPPGDAREDWAILRALSDVLGKTLDYNNLDELRARIYEAAPHLAETDMIVAADPAGLQALGQAAAGSIDKAPFASRIRDFYLSNPIARASKIMAECSALRQGAERLVAAE